MKSNSCEFSNQDWPTEDPCSGMSLGHAAEVKAWVLARKPAKRWSNQTYVAHVERLSATIEGFLSHP